MASLKKTIKAGLVAGVCGVGLCAVARKFKLTSRAAEFIHSMEGVPFPGTSIYAFLTTRQLRVLYSEIAEEIAASDPYGQVLDIGTGPGYLPIELALRDPDVRVVGLDTSQDMVRIARANATASNLGKRVEFSPGDPANLPYPGRYFDLVVSVSMLHHWPDPAAVFGEVYHVLKPGGEFWIYDYRREVPEEVWESFQCKLPFHLRLPFIVGPTASWKAAYKEEDLIRFASESHFEEPRLEQRALTVCRQRMPVFNVLKLRKPAQVRD